MFLTTDSKYHVSLFAWVNVNLLQVYKVLVRKTLDESWVVFRRYTDFSRLNDKVSKMLQWLCCS